MKCMPKEEAGDWLEGTQHAAAAAVLRGTFLPNSTLCTISTEGKDGLSVFDLARFFRAHLSPIRGVLIWVEAKEPFTEAEERHLFETYLKVHSGYPSECLWLEYADEEVFVATFAMCLLFRWDFWVVSDALPLVARHSHDSGLSLYRAPEELLQALSQLGFASPPASLES
jgi:hypothetical protein